MQLTYYHIIPVHLPANICVTKPRFLCPHYQVLTPSYWEIRIRDVLVKKPGQEQVVRLNVCDEIKGCKAAIDTGTSLITGPSRMYHHQYFGGFRNCFFLFFFCSNFH
jgi:hypothetical protein